MTIERATRTLRCDCGFVAAAALDAELVRLVQSHAVDVHGMHLDAALILQLARSPTQTWHGTDRAGRE